MLFPEFSISPSGFYWLILLVNDRLDVLSPTSSQTNLFSNQHPRSFPSTWKEYYIKLRSWLVLCWKDRGYLRTSELEKIELSTETTPTTIFIFQLELKLPNFQTLCSKK